VTCPSIPLSQDSRPVHIVPQGSLIGKGKRTTEPRVVMTVEPEDHFRCGACLSVAHRAGITAGGLQQHYGWCGPALARIHKISLAEAELRAAFNYDQRKKKQKKEIRRKVKQKSCIFGVERLSLRERMVLHLRTSDHCFQCGSRECESPTLTKLCL